MVIMQKFGKLHPAFYNFIFLRSHTASSESLIRVLNESPCSILDPVPERVPLKQHLSLTPLASTDEVLPLRNSYAERLQFWKREHETSITNVRATGLQQVKIRHEGPPENLTLIMNRYLSTPYDCALRASQFFSCFFIF